MKQNNKLTKAEAVKRTTLSYDSQSLIKHGLDNGLNEFDILRRAYELIFENSQFFYEQLAIAFSIESKKVSG